MFYTHQHTCMYIGWSQPYKYTADLLCLDFCRLPVEHCAHKLSMISTPLQVDKWSEAPAAHPNQAFVCYVCDRICFGFRISFDHFFQQRSATTNMQSAFEHPGVISQHLQKELSLGHLLGPLEDTSDLPPLQINRLGVIIPKGHNMGKWRLITDLSFPWHCVRSTTLQWRTPRKLSQKWPMGTLLAKFGIESAYRQIPVHPPRLPPSSNALGRQDLY